MMNAEFRDILDRRITRRMAVKMLGMGAAGITALATYPALAAKGRTKPSILVSQTALQSEAFNLNFIAVSKGYTQDLVVAEGYHASPLIRWGDRILPLQQGLSPSQIQARSFGYNNDFIAYLPLNGSQHGILHVNHEYTNAHLMFPNTQEKTASQTLNQEQSQVEQQAHGFSVLEVKKTAPNQWKIVPDSMYARRVTATTAIAISGPAAGNPRMQTAADPSGKMVLGTLGNCSGGVTPWGTVLVSEENIDGYFSGTVEGLEFDNHKRYTIAQKPYYGWHRFDARFDIAQNPNEPNRFGWVVEYDPRNPKSQPVKRTALGRFKHETATCTIAPDGRVVVYSGDDDYFEYIYRFVSNEKLSSANRKNLLDDGILYVAQFKEDGRLKWLPLVFGQGALTPQNGFQSQADVLIETRRAADISGATQMDRPEGIAIQPFTNHVFVSLTKNPKREKTNAANPRVKNDSGHIVKMIPPGGNHAANEFAWDIHILAGDPDKQETNYNGRVSKNGWFGNPDNLAFHPSGSLWIATDGMPELVGSGDGLYATSTLSPPKCFLRAPKGAEVTGPCFTPDGQTLFVSIQHPGEDEGSTYDNPSTRWPDFMPNRPPRPTVVAITPK